MGSVPVQRQNEDGVTTLTLNRPERRNALSAEMVQALHDALDAIGCDESVRVVVLTGAGKGFCAGGDLAGGFGAASGVLEAHRGRGHYAEVLTRLSRLPQPVIAAVNGDALGGGFGLAMACDLVVVDPAARMGTPEIRVGLFPMVILAVLQRNAPRKPLLEMILDGQRIDAQRALELNLVNRVSAEGAALQEAVDLARRLAARSPAILALGKAAFYRVADLPFEDALAYLNTQLTLNLLTEDAMEGIAAFLQKRQPQWKGR
ncbi:MAG: enoyl-CoA hydratase/isomerase family protein [Deltaproteobacteria bacterium]|nr:enoyl-CoA hydratase/isomerase family protein [Deltaproteobacteria bacterium]MBW2253210.1 enoyl-CoA hydratase/isomerase family protein [Deltaproteobacteria bacterium]